MLSENGDVIRIDRPGDMADRLSTFSKFSAPTVAFLAF